MDAAVKKHLLSIQAEIISNGEMIKKMFGMLQSVNQSREVLVTEYEAENNISYNTIRKRYKTFRKNGRYYVEVDAFGKAIVER